MNAWTAQETKDHGALSLCVCAVGMVGEVLPPDTTVTARASRISRCTHGVATHQVARAVGISEPVVTRNLDRLSDDGLLGSPPCGVIPAFRSYRLAY